MTKFSRFVYVASGVAVVGVATWKMAFWDRSSLWARLGDYAYLETAHWERQAGAGLLIPPGEDLDALPLDMTNGAIAASLDVEWTNAVVLPYLSGSFGLDARIMRRLESAEDSLEADRWAVGGFWDVTGETAIEYPPSSSLDTRFWDIVDGTITNWPAIPTNNQGYVVASLPIAAANVYPAMMFRISSVPHWQTTGLVKRATATAVFTNAVNVFATNEVPQIAQQVAIGRAFNAASWEDWTSATWPDGYSLLSASADVHASRVPGGANIEADVTLEARWPGGPVAYALLPSPRFYADGHGDCIVNGASMIVECLAVGTVNLDDPYNILARDAAEQATEGIVKGMAPAVAVSQWWADYDDPTVTRTAFAIPLRQTTAGEDLYPLWTWDPPALPTPTQFLDLDLFSYGTWPRYYSIYETPDPALEDYYAHVRIEFEMRVVGVLLSFGFETYARPSTNGLQWVDRRAD